MRNQNTRADKSIKIHKKKYGDIFKKKGVFEPFQKKNINKVCQQKKKFNIF